MNKVFIYLSVFSVISLLACEKPVREFNGFTKAELEFLLAGDSAHVWQRVSRSEDGEEIDFSDCRKNNRMIFHAADLDGVQKLLYAYDTNVCDSAGFCNEFPAYCLSDTIRCHDDPEFCSALSPGTLYIATWEVTGVTADYEITDMVRIIFPGYSNIANVSRISSEYFEWEYDDHVPGIGIPVRINEKFQKIK